MLCKIRERLTCTKGFTLVELLAIVAIIGVLAAIAIPRYQNATKEATAAKVLADLRTIDSAVSLYNASNGVWPALTDLAPDYLAAVPTAPTGVSYGLNASLQAIATIGGVDYTSDTNKATIKSHLP